MPTLQHTRSTGQRHTYTIVVNAKGTYVISMAGKVLKVGMSGAVSNPGSTPAPASVGDAIQEAIAAIEGLRGMREE